MSNDVNARYLPSWLQNGSDWYGSGGSKRPAPTCVSVADVPFTVTWFRYSLALYMLTMALLSGPQAVSVAKASLRYCCQ